MRKTYETKTHMYPHRMLLILLQLHLHLLPPHPFLSLTSPTPPILHILLLMRSPLATRLTTRLCPLLLRLGLHQPRNILHQHPRLRIRRFRRLMVRRVRDVAEREDMWVFRLALRRRVRGVGELEGAVD